MAETKTNVLVVDDDPAMVRILVKWLGDAYTVRSAADAKQAMLLIQQECPDVLITDWEMPGLTGLQLVKWLRAQQLPRYVYSILLTIRCGKADIVQGFEAGTDSFLKKPVDRDELLARLLSGNRVVELEQKLREMSRCDTLTGLLNHSTFHTHLEMEWGRVTRLPIPLSCVLLDIDQFQRVNTEYGQAQADLALRTVGEMLRANSRVSDAICRYANDRFAVLLVEATQANARQWAERIRLQMESLTIPVPNQEPLQLTASFGVAERSGETLCGEHLLDLAEKALQVAKQTGRNRVSAHSALPPVLGSTPRTVGDTFESLTARDVMSTNVPELHRADPAEKALRFLLRFNLCEVPVVDQSRQLIGSISEQELMAATLQVEWKQQVIRDLVRHEVHQFSETTAALEIYGYFSRTNARSVVITQAGCPVGIVYRQALLLWLADACAVEQPPAIAAADQPIATSFLPQPA